MPFPSPPISKPPNIFKRENDPCKKKPREATVAITIPENLGSCLC